MPPRWTTAILVFTLLALCGMSVAPAADLYVNCESGSDAGEGTVSAPYKTIAMGMKRVRAGDTVHLVKTKTPFRESLQFVDISGEPGKPITVDGHDATIEGSKPIVPSEWTKVGDDLYRNDKLLFPERILRRQKENDDAMLGRYFFVWNSRMNLMGRSSKGDDVPLPAPKDLKPGEWTFVREEMAFYLKTQPGKTLEDERITYPFFTNAVQFAGRCEHIVLKNLTATHVINDGIGFVGYCRDVLIDHFRAIECGDDGMSAHEDNQFETRDFVSIGNSTGLCHVSNSSSINRHALFMHNHAYEIYVLGSGTHEFHDTVVIPERIAVSVFNVAAEGRPASLANPAYDTGPSGMHVTLDNVLVRDDRTDAQRTTPGANGRKPRTFMVETWGPHNLVANDLTLCGVDLVGHDDAKISLTNSVIGGARKPSILLDATTTWKASSNAYDLAEIVANGTHYKESELAAYSQKSGQDSGSTWKSVKCEPRDPSKLPDPNYRAP